MTDPWRHVPITGMAALAALGSLIASRLASRWATIDATSRETALGSVLLRWRDETDEPPTPPAPRRENAGDER